MQAFFGGIYGYGNKFAEASPNEYRENGFYMRFKFPSFRSTFQSRGESSYLNLRSFSGLRMGFYKLNGEKRIVHDIWDTSGGMRWFENLTETEVRLKGTDAPEYDKAPLNPYAYHWYNRQFEYPNWDRVWMTQWKWFVEFYEPYSGPIIAPFEAYIPARRPKNLSMSLSNAGCSLTWGHAYVFDAKTYVASVYESDNSLTVGTLKGAQQSITGLNTFLSMSLIPGSFYTAEIISVDYNNQLGEFSTITSSYRGPPTSVTNVRLIEAENYYNTFDSFTSISWSGGLSNRRTNTVEFHFSTNSSSDFSLAHTIVNASSNPGRYLFNRVPGYFYRARVIVRNDFGSVTSTFSNWMVTTPHPPTSLAIASLTSQGIVPTWINAPGNVNYDVFVRYNSTSNVDFNSSREFTGPRRIKSGELISFSPTVGNYYAYEIYANIDTAYGVGTFTLYSYSELSPVRRYVTQTTPINHITLRWLSNVGASVSYFNLVNQNLTNVSSSENTLQIFSSPNGSYNNLSLVKAFTNVNTNQGINFPVSKGMFYTAQLVYTDDYSGSKISPYSSFSLFAPATLDNPIMFSLTANSVIVHYPIMPGNTYSVDIYEEQSSYSSSVTLRSSRQRLGTRMTSSPFNIPFDGGLVGGGTFLNGLYPTAWYYGMVTMTNDVGTRSSTLFHPNLQRLQYVAPPTTASFLQLASLTRDNLFVTWSGVMGADTIQVNLFQSSDIFNANTPTHSSYTYATSDLRKPTNFVTTLPIPYNNSQSLAISVSNRLPAGNYGVNLIARNNFGSYTSFFSAQRFLS
jgi:hypothetical protein